MSINVCLQRGLNDLDEFLIKEGFNTCTQGECLVPADVYIVDVPDFEYQNQPTIDCRDIGGSKALVINAYGLSYEEIVDIIKSRACACF